MQKCNHSEIHVREKEPHGVGLAKVMELLRAIDVIIRESTALSIVLVRFPLLKKMYACANVYI